MGQIWSGPRVCGAMLHGRPHQGAETEGQLLAASCWRSVLGLDLRGDSWGYRSGSGAASRRGNLLSGLAGGAVRGWLAARSALEVGPPRDAVR